MSKTQCYLEDCQKDAYPDSYWCTRTHQLEWQEKTYGRTFERKTPITIPEIQARLLEMGKRAAKEENRPKSGASNTA